MGLMLKKLMTADVTLSGMADDSISSDVAAEVEFVVHGRGERPRDLAELVPMTVVGTLRACQTAPNHGRPFIDICREVADALLGYGPAGIESFRIREVIDKPIDVSEFSGFEESVSEEMVEWWLRQCMPQVTAQARTGHHRRFKATLQVRRKGGGAFVYPWSRNAFVAVQGTFAMFEAAARTRDYAATTLAIAATTRRLLDFNDDVFGPNPIPELGEATWLYQLVEAIYDAEDPLTANFPTFVEGESAHESIMGVKLGRWARVSGLSSEAAAHELTRRLQAGEPMPWEEARPGQ